MQRVLEHDHTRLHLCCVRSDFRAEPHWSSWANSLQARAGHPGRSTHTSQAAHLLQGADLLCCASHGLESARPSARREAALLSRLLLLSSARIGGASELQNRPFCLRGLGPVSPETTVEKELTDTPLSFKFILSRNERAAGCPQKSGAHFTSAAMAVGLQLFGDSLGCVRVYEQNNLQSTVCLLDPPANSEWSSEDEAAKERFAAECGDRAVASIVPFGRGFAAVTRGGFLALCNLVPGKCAPVSASLPVSVCPSLSLSFPLSFFVSLSLSLPLPLCRANTLPFPSPYLSLPSCLSPSRSCRASTLPFLSPLLRPSLPLACSLAALRAGNGKQLLPLVRRVPSALP